MSETPACLLCGHEREDLLHVFKCRATAHVRHAKQADPLFDTTWQQCGVLQFDHHFDEEIRNLDSNHDLTVTVDITSNARRRDAWTDGACERNASDRFRRAGSGVFFGHAHFLNASVLLPGTCQINQRAELFAIVIAVKIAGSPLLLRTDSEWCVMIWSAIVIAGCFHSGAFDHEDLWLELLMLTRRQPFAADGMPWLILQKVKAHAIQEDIDRGVISGMDAEGNFCADKLATEGAKIHSVPGHVVRRHAKLIKNTVWWQIEAILTLQERNKQIKDLGFWNASHEAAQIDNEICEELSVMPIAAQGGEEAQYPNFAWGFPTLGAKHAVILDPATAITGKSWQYKRVLHDLIGKYFNDLQWAVNNTNYVSWIELTLDFSAASGVWPSDNDFKQQGLIQQMRVFRSAVKHFCKLHKIKLWPDHAVPQQYISVLRPLGMPSVPGLCNVRPVFRCHSFVDEFLMSTARAYDKAGNPFNIPVPKLPCPCI
ncbi:unnamed protein product [Polarella glacialis]|uniref:RNase H type-1 domain-containing protein n=1 Tax=Polarella glacialis TaxID=89957 RepID=A0A813KC70_POLGL|nr:unnamed protein product [Polarella glacialis]